MLHGHVFVMQSYGIGDEYTVPLISTGQTQHFSKTLTKKIAICISSITKCASFTNMK